MKDTAILYLGAFAPQGADERNSATSTAAVIFQTNFLDAWVESYLPDPEVRCYYPVPSFPRSRRLFCTARRDSMENGLQIRSLPHINLGALKILTLGLSSAWAVFSWALRNRGHRRVVVSYNLNAPPAYFVGPVCRWLGVRFVPFVGDIYVPGEVTPDTWLRRLEFAAQQRALPKADGLIVCNASIIEDFAQESRHILVEGGVRESFVRRFAGRRGEGTAFRVVFAGQLSELNGVSLLLDAMRVMDDPDVRVTVMGGGAQERAVREAAAQDPRIEFLGSVPHERVLAEYQRADLLLNLRSTAHRTHRYVFPSKVVECLATGVPLLSTRTGHVDTEFGMMVLPLDEQTPEALAAAILAAKAMGQEERDALGRRAQEYVLHNKTWEAHLRRLAEFLEEEAAA